METSEEAGGSRLTRSPEDAREDKYNFQFWVLLRSSGSSFLPGDLGSQEPRSTIILSSSLPIAISVKFVYLQRFVYFQPAKGFFEACGKLRREKESIWVLVWGSWRLANQHAIATMELCESTGDDRFSDVPTNVITEHILTLLPIKDAARTSILSRNWRHHWRSIPQLVFDRNFAPPHYLPDDSEKVAANIHRAVLLHDGSITKFELDIPGLMGGCPKIDDELIPCLPSKIVREVALLFSVHQAKANLDSSSLFTSCHHLTVLKLKNCSFSTAPSCFVGLRKLAVLELEDVVMPKYFLRNLLLECTLLEELRVVNCSKQKLVLLTPSLKLVVFRSLASEFRLNPAPLLSVLSLPDGCDYEYENTSLLALFASLSALKQLTFGLNSLLFPAESNDPYKVPTTLCVLKVVELSRLSLESLSHARFLLRLITSSPNLQKLTIRVGFYLLTSLLYHTWIVANNAHHPPSDDIDSLQMLLGAEEEQSGLGCLQHLEEVHIQDSLATQVELDLVRFVLVTAPRLRTIFIKRALELSIDKVVRFLNELRWYKYISKEVVVEYV
ncbi:unnamed protein product [Linum tenue]|uniref:F-box domain-containing protein n=1 Tax=Linum tenue TaxID=586396 RepID=A0AAV0NJ09_9ROSI|nr:unnamed protein product [Linum tenue]